MESNAHVNAPVSSDEDATPAASARLDTMSDSYRDILYLTGPLVLSSTGLMLMHIVDALFLSWYSKEAIAIVGPASMGGFMVMAFFIGVAGYTSTLVAQYLGAKRPERAGASVWQGLYFAVAAGLLVAIAGGFLAKPLFAWVNHAPLLQPLEAQYFTIMCLSAPVSLVGAALSGFFSGRGDNVALMAAQVTGFVFNAFLSYACIFGKWGFPEGGSSGAAAATAGAQALVTLILTAMFFAPRHRQRFLTWRARAFDWELLKRLSYFGAFAGMRFVAEIVAWTIFLFFVGRLGTNDIVATNIVWRLNGLAFFPLIGLSTAIATLVGHAQGAGRSERAVKVTWRGIVISEAWMLFAALLFVLFPHQLLSIFSGPEDFEQIMTLGVVLLRFVAAYCVLDGLNIIFLGALQGAGDTRWTLFASVVLHVIFVGVLVTLEQLKMDLYAFWGAATAFVMLQAFVWMARFKSGAWKKMQVIEPSPP